MIDLLERLQNTVHQRRLLSPNEPVIIAVSGGLDSMVLLHLFAEWSKVRPRRLVVAHFNHRLRGAESNQDEAFVRETSVRMGIEFKSGAALVKQFALRKRLSIEMAARQLRHEFLARSAVALAIPKVALAHHLDDQIELFFLRLMRGAGTEGLCGMKSLSPSPADPTVVLIRPLLDISKADLETFASQTGIKFREDPSNQEVQFERNRIRHELLPWLRQKFQPGLNQTVSRLMEVLRSEVEVIDNLGKDLLGRGTPFDLLPLAIQRRWLREQCLSLGVSAEFDLIERLRYGCGNPFAVNESLIITRDADGKVHLRQNGVVPFRAAKRVVSLSKRSGFTDFEGVTVRWKLIARRGAAPPQPRQRKGLETFDADKVGPKAWLRHWTPGDRFQPIGMANAVKVQNLFTNLKIPKARRRQLLMATTAAGEVFWIEGVRISEKFKIDDESVRYLEWQWNRQDTHLHV